MNLNQFLSDCSWALWEDNGTYHMALETDTHRIDLFVKDDKILTYEAYNELDDSSVILSDEELRQIKKFIFNNYDKTRTTKT